MCKDPVVDYLADFGFNVIRLPRAGLRPGAVLIGTGSELARFGPIESLWRSESPVPTPSDKAPATLLRGRRTRKFTAKIGLSIAEQLLAALHLDAPKFRASMEPVDEVDFGFVDPFIASLELADLGNYLARGSLDDASPVVARFVTVKAPPVHVITDLLTTSSLSVEVSTGRAAGLELDLKRLAEAVDANLSVEASSQAFARLTFRGAQELAFGFRALRIRYEDGAWQVPGFAKPGSVFMQQPADPAAWASRFDSGEVTIRDLSEGG